MTTVFVTGANRGLGLEFVRQYAADGARVIACCRDPKKAQELKTLAEKFPQTLRVCALDVSDAASVKNVATEVREEPIDILINNAGIFGGEAAQQSFGTLDYPRFQEVLATNTVAPIRIAETLLGNVARSQGKKLIFITSKMGSITDNTSGRALFYRASKAALNMMVKSIAIDLKTRGITAIVLHPGWVQTDMGSANAPTTVKDSISGMRRVITGLTLEKSGQFFDFEGATIAW